MSELNANTKCVIHLLCFVSGALLVQTLIAKKGDKEPLSDDQAQMGVGGTPAKFQPSSEKFEINSISLPHQHEKKMNERLFQTGSIDDEDGTERTDRKSTRLNSSHRR